MSSKPVIVIVHGSFHTPAPYQPIRDLLSAQGYKTHCPQLPCAEFSQLLPGCDPSSPDLNQSPPTNGPEQSQDADVIKLLLRTLVEEQGKEVLLLAHSSGGWTATESAIPNFQREKRRKEGKQGGVIGIFYIAAFLIEVGESVGGTFAKAVNQPKEGEEQKSWFTPHPCGLNTVTDGSYFLFHDLDPDEAQKWSKGLTACPVLKSTLTNDAYSTLPCAYLVCEQDRVLPLPFQEGMIKGAEQKSGKKMELYQCPGGHEPFLSYPKECVTSIEKFIWKCT